MGSQPAGFAKLADGPVVLTDAFAAGVLAVFFYALPAGQDCTLPSGAGGLTADPNRLVGTVDSQNQAFHGARLVINATEELCAWWSTNSNTAVVNWSGFKPY